jgi:predicted NBD/HSP70 family sugar kinase
VASEVIVQPTPQNCKAIENIFTKAAKDFKADGLAVATAGVVHQNRLLGKPINLPSGYEKIDFTALTGLPCIIENDANAAMYAEYKIGNLRGLKNGIMLTLGTDTGCGLICDGRILRGKCGATGEVSFPFSGRDLRRLAAAHGVTETDCFAIYEAARQGETAARAAYHEWEDNLISGLKLLNGLFDTERFVLSGSLSQIVDYAKVATTLALLQPHNPADLKPAICGTDAGIIGAALLWTDTYAAK